MSYSILGYYCVIIIPSLLPLARVCHVTSQMVVPFIHCRGTHVNSFFFNILFSIYVNKWSNVGTTHGCGMESFPTPNSIPHPCERPLIKSCLKLRNLRVLQPHTTLRITRSLDTTSSLPTMKYLIWVIPDCCFPRYNARSRWIHRFA